MPSERDKAVAQAACESRIEPGGSGDLLCWVHYADGAWRFSDLMPYEQARGEMTRWRRARVAELQAGEVAPSTTPTQEAAP